MNAEKTVVVSELPVRLVCRARRGIRVIACSRQMAIGALVLFALGLAPGASTFAQIERGKEIVEASFRFNGESDAIAVPVSFNAHRVTFALDTACTITAFDAAYRHELGAPIRSMTIHTADARATKMDVFKAPRATIGETVLDGVAAVICADLSNVRELSGTEIRGVLGLDYLFRHVVRVDFDRGQVDLLKAVPENSGVRVPLGLSSRDIPSVVLDVGGVGRRSFLIDSAFLGTGYVDRRFAAELLAGRYAAPLDLIVESFDVLGTRRTADLAVAKVSIGEFSHAGLHFTEGDANMIGLHYLSRYIVTFDFPRGNMYLKPGRRFDEPDRRNLSGLAITRRDGITNVARLRDGGAGHAAGLKLGDTIERLDGRPATDFTLLQIRRLFTKPGTYKLRVKRGNDTLDIVLVLSEPKEPAAPNSGSQRGHGKSSVGVPKRTGSR